MAISHGASYVFFPSSGKKLLSICMHFCVALCGNVSNKGWRVNGIPTKGTFCSSNTIFMYLWTLTAAACSSLFVNQDVPWQWELQPGLLPGIGTFPPQSQLTQQPVVFQWCLWKLCSLETEVHAWAVRKGGVCLSVVGLVFLCKLSDIVSKKRIMNNKSHYLPKCFATWRPSFFHVFN